MVINSALQSQNHLDPSDVPKEHYSEDALGYATFAYRIANSISNIPSRHGTIIGIYGEWGTGKTTVLNFIRSYLKDLAPAEQPIVIPFNPWWFSGEEALVSRFFETLLTYLSKSPISSHVIDAMTSIADILADVPSDYSWIARTSRHVLGKLKKKDLATFREVARKELLKQHRKILVIVDDLDRLLPDEVQIVCKLIKLISELPNIICLVAMDKAVVTRALNSITKTIDVPEATLSGEINKAPMSGKLRFEPYATFGEEFLDKIIQTPHDLPRPDRYSMRNLFWEVIEEILGNYEVPFDGEYFRRVYIDGLESLLDTPRRITRFRNGAYANFAAVKGEVHTVDFLAIEVLRLYCPDAYLIMRDSPKYFVNRDEHNIGSLLSLTDDQVKQFHEGWVQKLPPEKVDAVKTIITAIFPKVYKALKGGLDISFTSKLHDEKLMARNDQQFPVYFSYAIADYHISNTEMKSLISCGKDELVQRLRELAKQKSSKGDNSTRLLAFLETFEKYVHELDDAEVCLFISTFLLIGDELTLTSDYAKGKLGGIPLGNQEKIYFLIRSLLGRLKNQKERYQIIADSLSATSILTATRTIMWLQKCDEKGPQVQNYDRGAVEDWDNPRVHELQTFFSPEQLKRLQEIAVNKMQEAGSDILLCPDPRFVFCGWTDWDRDGLRTFAKDQFTTDASVLDLLFRFLKTGVHDYQTLDAMFGLEKLVETLDSIPSETLSDDQKSAIDYAKRCLQQKKKEEDDEKP